MATSRVRDDAAQLLRAYRALGQLADLTQPRKAFGPSGRQRSGNGLLKELGLADYEAAAAIWVGRMPENAFLSLFTLDPIPKPWTASNRGRKARSTAAGAAMLARWEDR